MLLNSKKYTIIVHYINILGEKYTGKAVYENDKQFYCYNYKTNSHFHPLTVVQFRHRLPLHHPKQLMNQNVKCTLIN